MLGRLESLAEELSDWVDSHPGSLFAVFSLVYFPTFLGLAAQRPFWFDELFTLYMTMQPTVADIIDRVREGVDQQPLAYYLIHQPLLAAPGGPDPLAAFRLPAICGVWLGCLGLFWLVTRRTSAVHGWVAVFFLLMTPVMEYAIEARPYGLVVGFTALALLAYQFLTDGRRRWLAAAMLGLALFAAVSSSYYAVLSYFAIALAELARIWMRKRIDWAVVAALGVSTAAVLLYLPYVSSSVGGFDKSNWASPFPMEIYNEYAWILRFHVSVVVACLMAWGGWRMLHPRPEGPEAIPKKWEIPRVDLAAAIGLTLLPVAQYVVATTVTNMMTGRYVLQSSLGFSILAAFALYSAGRARKINGLFVMLLLASRFVAVGVAPAATGSYERVNEPTAIARLLEGQRTDLPVVIDSPMDNLEFSHRGPDEVRQRLYYLVDPPAARRISRHIVDGGEFWLSLQKHMPIRAVRRQEFLSEHRQFLLCSRGSLQSYLVRTAMEEGATLELLASTGDIHLYWVRYQTEASGSESPTESSIK